MLAIRVHVAAAVSLIVTASWCLAAESPSRYPVILVHGIAWDLDEEDGAWGYGRPDADGSIRQTGMIGYLQSQGLPFGGTFRPRLGKVELPGDLDTYGVEGDPREARLFVLKFSLAANTDGIGYKALELAETIRQVRELTCAEKVRLVAHSAGGLIARVYLQGALPGVPYRGDVDRLVTIATPHLGSSLSEHFGDFLGTRATSIKPSAGLIRQLNNSLELPDDVTFASIVVRGVAADLAGQAKDLADLVDPRVLAGLPLEYRLGGDEVVHVESQNLRLAACAGRYEARTGRPVQYVLARVPDPTPGSYSLKAARVHVVAPSDPAVGQLVLGLVRDRAALWRKSRPDDIAPWCEWQARLHAGGVIESQAGAKHPMSHVRSVKVEDLRLVSQEGNERRYAFDGKAWSIGQAVGLNRRWTRVRGTLDLTFDDFGRVMAAQSSVDQREDL